jgi:endonuclease/exonuclease/phosphatase family metal-dependent hydrolase
MSVAKTTPDINKVYAQQPDFITFNEVSGRSDAMITRPGYALQRTPGTYTGATAVVWDTARWTKVAAGTYQVSNMRGKTKKQKIEWGIRYANWVTVRNNTDGRTMSVIAAHVSPICKYTVGITIPSYQRIAALAKTLSAHGPVLMAGDFNVNYHSKAYPRTEIASLGLVNAFDLWGSAPATHDSGAVIDHVYLYKADSLLPITNLVNMPLNSDHRLLMVDLGTVAARVGAFAAGAFTNSASRRAIPMRLLRDVIDKAPTGSSLHLATRSLTGPVIYNANKSARKRGVNVQIITGDRKLTTLDRKLAKLLGTKKKHKSWARTQPHWHKFHLPTAFVLASTSGGTNAVRIDFNRPWVWKVQKKTGSIARVRTDLGSYDLMFDRFFAAVGRKLS